VRPFSSLKCFLDWLVVCLYCYQGAVYILKPYSEEDGLVRVRVTSGLFFFYSLLFWFLTIDWVFWCERMRRCSGCVLVLLVLVLENSHMRARLHFQAVKTSGKVRMGRLRCDRISKGGGSRPSCFEE
jgi:hypothetical protein